MGDALSITHLGLSVVAGSLTTLSPCVFPLLPLVLGGLSPESRWSPVAMGAGMASSFAGVGLLLGLAGASLGISQDSIRTFGGAMLLLLAIVMLVPRLAAGFASLMSPISNRANWLSQKVNGQSLPGAFLLGALLGIVWSPCSGPLLASALTLVATEGGVSQGAAVLGAFGVGAAIPLVAVAYASRAGFLRAKQKVLAKIDGVKNFFAVLLGLTGIAIITGFDKRLEALIINALPDWWIQLSVSI